MNKSTNGVDILTRLGLTRCNAQVYLAILNLEEPTAKAIAQTLQIAKAEAYRATTQLLKLGLIKKIIANPTVFKALPMADTVSLLVEQINERREDDCREAKLFLQNYVGQKEEPAQEVEYILRQGYRAEVLEFGKCLAALQTSSDLIAHWAGIVRMIDLHFEAYKRALKRGVRFRYLATLPLDQKMPEKILRLKQVGALEIRHIDNVPSGGFDLLDDRYIHVINVPYGVFSKMEVLRSNNPTLLEFARDYFELKWHAGTTPNWQDSNPSSVIVA